SCRVSSRASHQQREAPPMAIPDRDVIKKCDVKAGRLFHAETFSTPRRKAEPGKHSEKRVFQNA
ncbi:MAG TPA: hypothetical protein VIJ85_13850, partial [Rhizomicrobium sp.]